MPTKYNVTFQLKVSAETPEDAIDDAIGHVTALELPPAEAFTVIPTGGVTGEPRTAEGPGWMCVFSIEEAD